MFIVIDVLKNLVAQKMKCYESLSQTSRSSFSLTQTDCKTSQSGFSKLHMCTLVTFLPLL